MNLEALKTVVTSKVARQVLTVQKNSPTILFASGIVGVVATTVLASKATLKLEEVLDDVEQRRALVNGLVNANYSERDRQKDHVIVTVQGAVSVAKLYAPAVIVGVASVAALTGSHVVLSRRNAAVMAAYSALDKGFGEYRERVREELGEEKDLEFRHGTETITETVVDDKGKSKTVERKKLGSDLPSIYARYFDEASKNWSREPEYNRAFLSCQQNWANEMLRARGHLFLNEVYDMLGLSRSKAGAAVGWVIGKDGDNFVDFGVFNPDNSRTRMFVNTDERTVLLDFNVDGVIWDLIDEEPA